MYSVILSEIYINDYKVSILCKQLSLDIFIHNLKSEIGTQDEIEQKEYKDLKYCDLSDNRYVISVINVSGRLRPLTECSPKVIIIWKNLYILIVPEKSAINQEGMNIQILNASGNRKIKSAKWCKWSQMITYWLSTKGGHYMEELEELNCSRNCGIDQQGISQCKKLQSINSLFNDKWSSYLIIMKKI